ELLPCKISYSRHIPRPLSFSVSDARLHPPYVLMSSFCTCPFLFSALSGGQSPYEPPSSQTRKQDRSPGIQHPLLPDPADRRLILYPRKRDFLHITLCVFLTILSAAID